MNFHDREFFVSRIRTGKVFLNIRGEPLTVLPPTIEDTYHINLAYKESYDASLDVGLITEREMLEWMREKNVWTTDDDIKEKGVKEDLEKIRVEAYKNRQDVKLVKSLRNLARKAERAAEMLASKKVQHTENCCEGIALIAKAERFIELCTYSGDRRYDFDKIPVSYVHNEYNSHLCTEPQLRELARSEPWKTLWNMKDVSGQLFQDLGREMSTDQKNLIVWSRIYDNVQESMDCPPAEVINDDLLLDGWFIVQKREREQEAIDKDFDNSTNNEKIKNAGEIYIMSKDREHAKKIHNMNSEHAKHVKAERGQVVRQKGKAFQHDFPDQKQMLQRMSQDALKEHYRRK